MLQAESLTSHHAPVCKERGVRYCNNETVSDMGLERPQRVTERACCAGHLEVMGRPLCESASVWRGLRGLDWSRPVKRGVVALWDCGCRAETLVPGQTDGKEALAEFSQNQIPDSGWASPFFSPSQKLRVPCNVATTPLTQRHNTDSRT